MMSIDKKMIAKLIRKLFINQNDKIFILRNELEDLNLDSEEKEYALELLKELNVKMVDYEITKKSRSLLVSDFDYGEVSGYDLGYLDMPIYAKLEYNDDGELIDSDFSLFDEYIEKEFIPNYIYKDEKNEQYIIKFQDIIRHRFCEEETKYLMNYLKNKDIYVHGYSASFCGEFDNYIRTGFNNNSSTSFYCNFDLLNEKIIEYKNNPSLDLRNEIIILCIGLVKKIAYSLSKTVSLSVPELESFGYEALIDAIDGYDINNGSKFSTYASTAIKWGITNGIPKLLGFNSALKFNKYYIAKGIVESKNMTYLEEDIFLVDQIIDIMVENNDIVFGDEYKRKILLLNPDNLDNYIDDSSMDSLIQDNLFSLEILNSLVAPIIKEEIEKLDEKELKVINWRYGFDNGNALNFREIGDILGVSRERIRQIHNEAIEKLSRIKNIKMLKDYIEEYDSCNYNPNVIVSHQSKIEKRYFK